MARAEWGLWADELDEVALMQMALAYMRRKRYEARLVASEVGRLFGGLAAGGRSDRDDPATVMGMIGVDW